MSKICKNDLDLFFLPYRTYVLVKLCHFSGIGCHLCSIFLLSQQSYSQANVVTPKALVSLNPMGMVW